MFRKKKEKQYHLLIGNKNCIDDIFREKYRLEAEYKENELPVDILFLEAVQPGTDYMYISLHSSLWNQIRYITIFEKDHLPFVEPYLCNIAEEFLENCIMYDYYESEYITDLESHIKVRKQRREEYNQKMKTELIEKIRKPIEEFNSIPDDVNIITLCGSVQYYEEFRNVATYLEYERNICVFQPLHFSKSRDKNTFESLSEYDKNNFLEKASRIHKKMIERSDGIFVINPIGLVGKSTKEEIEYAIRLGKHIFSLKAITFKDIKI